MESPSKKVRPTNNVLETLIKIFELYKRNELPKVDEEFLVKYRRDNLTEKLAEQLNNILKALPL